MNGASAPNGTTFATGGGTGFLSFNSHPPRVYITAEDVEFDETTLQIWRDEGYHVSYCPMGDGGKAYLERLRAIPKNLKLGESYALVAFGDAATVCLDVATKPMPHCIALVCYYPTAIPHPHQKYPSQLHLVVHTAETQNLSASFQLYVYPEVEEGFAEHDLDQFDHVAADLAWSRSLGAVRKGFKQSADLDAVKDAFSALTLGPQRSATGAINAMVQTAHVNYVPTGTGGIGRKALHHFYEDFFIPGSPPTLQIRLVSRTSGADRVVDEMVVSFRHTQEIPWILPGVPPTGRQVEIPIVSVVAFRGGKLAHERVYWDQASVLVQIGVLDPKNVPQALRSKGCRRLPVLGSEAAKKVANVHSVPSNDLIRDW